MSAGYSSIMQLKIRAKWLLIILGVAALASSFVVVFFSIFPPSHQNLYASSTLSADGQVLSNFEQARQGLPTRIEIPKINVDAPVEDVGLTTEGAMAVPAGPTSTAWFDLGPRPGEIGSAVIAGHEGWKDGIGAVFDDLNKLRSGDKVYVESMGGATTTFVVSGTQIYDQNGDATDVFSSSDGKAHLNLITCEGAWNPATKTYSNRLVVFTDKI